MATQRKAEQIINNKLGTEKRELINFSVKAQDMILRAAAEGKVGGGGSIIGSPGGNNFKTTDDLVLSQQQQNMILNSLSLGIGGTNLTTNVSQEDPSRLLGQTIMGDGGDLLLPSINPVRRGQASPFKGQSNNNAFFDMPMMLATQKMMRQTVRQAPERSSVQNIPGNAMVQNSKASPHETARHNHSADRNNAVKMNPKVLETWINETLQDAEHLDIPGVILKPEHKNPISRYGIDRLALTNAGIPNDMVDRIFRALFVYSVGFYELVKKCLQHTERKYSIITAIWKVFSILLEYCCKTDYRMLISEISKEHKEEMDRMEREFQQKFNEQAQNEMQLKKNIETLQRFSDDLEKEKNSERQMRLKLEEEYMQNTKNHEEEVQLRLKFESKLNNMHSVHRDLETKYKRALSELAGLQTINEQLYAKNNAQAEEITSLKTQKAELDSKISYNDEKLAGLQREIGIKVKQVQDLEQKFTTAQDELDMTKYKLQEMHKDLTEHKLKIDVYESQVTGLRNEKQHLVSELTQTKDLQKVYEKKCGTLITEINKLNIEFQESKREIIGFGEIQKEREERIDKLKTELRELKANFEELDLKHGTLTIQHEKIKEQYDTCKRDLDDAIEKLHLTNKVRHETELRLTEESERCRSLQDVIRDKDDQLHKRALEIEDLDKRVIDLERTNENLEVKKGAIERQFEITKKQLSEKIQSLTDVLQSEKETRDMWIERYEKEQREHTQTNAALLQAKSQLKDQILATKNVEIKLQTTSKANEVLTEQNTRLQDQLNEALANQENLERDVNTQKEIMKQTEANRKEYINKLKNDLLTVESRFSHRFDCLEMVSQDLMSRAAENLISYQEEKKVKEEFQTKLAETEKHLQGKIEELKDLSISVNATQMENEDFTSLIALRLDPQIAVLSKDLEALLQTKHTLERDIEDLKHEIQQKEKLQAQLTEVENEQKLLKSELHMMKKQNERLQNQIEAMEATQAALGSKNPTEVPQEQEKQVEKVPTQESLRQPSQQKSEGRKSSDKPLPSEPKASTRSINTSTLKGVRVVGVEIQTQTDMLMRDLDRQTPQQQMMMPQQFVGVPYNQQQMMMNQHQQTTPNASMLHQHQQTTPYPSMMSQNMQTSPNPSMLGQMMRPPYPQQQQQRMSPQMMQPQRLGAPSPNQPPQMQQQMYRPPIRPNMPLQQQQQMMPPASQTPQQMPYYPQQQTATQPIRDPSQSNQQQQMAPPQINNFDQQTFGSSPPVINAQQAPSGLAGLDIEGANQVYDEQQQQIANQQMYQQQQMVGEDGGAQGFQQRFPTPQQQQQFLTNSNLQNPDFAVAPQQMMLNEDGTLKQQDGVAGYFDPNTGQQMISPMNTTMPQSTMHNFSMTAGGVPGGPSDPNNLVGFGGNQGFNDTTMMPTSTMMSPMNNTLSTIQPMMSPGGVGGHFQFPQQNQGYIQSPPQFNMDPNSYQQQQLYLDPANNGGYYQQDPYMQYQQQQMGYMDPAQQQQYYDPNGMQAPIMEQMAEYEEDAGASRQPHLAPVINTNLDQRSQHSQGSQQQPQRQSSNRSNVLLNPSNGQRTPGTRVPIEFKGMNSVMQTQASVHSAASGSNKSMTMRQQPSNQQSMLPNINQLDRGSSQHSAKGGIVLDPPSSHSQRDHLNMSGAMGSHLDQQQNNMLPPIANTRMKVDISSNSNYNNNNRGLNSGGAGASIHTPLSQMSGYSQGGPLTAQQQQQQQNNNRMMPQAGIPGAQPGMQVPMQGTGGQQQHHPPTGPTQSDRKVVGKSSIRTLIKAAATRD